MVINSPVIIGTGDSTIITDNIAPGLGSCRGRIRITGNCLILHKAIHFRLKWHTGTIHYQLAHLERIALNLRTSVYFLVHIVNRFYYFEDESCPYFTTFLPLQI